MISREAWNKTILRECLQTEICVPYDQGLAYCKYRDHVNSCDYGRCPRRQEVA